MRNDNIKTKDIAWNTIGTVTYAAVSLLLSIAVIRISGSIEGGIFSFGFSTIARLVYITSFFGIRPMHIVDIKYRFSFKDYLYFAIKCALVAVFFGIAYVAIRYVNGTYTNVKSLLITILILHGAIDGLADCYESEYQRVNKLYMCGQSLFFRIVVFTLTLLITLYYTKSLLTAEIMALIVELIVFYTLNIVRSKGVFKTAKSISPKYKNRSLFFEALPLFLITFLDMYIFSSAKFSIDANLGDVYSGFYSLVFMPTNVIYLVMTLFMKPLLTPLSNAYYSNKKEYKKILKNTFLLALGIAVVFIVGTFICGNVYLRLVRFVTNDIYESIGTALVFNSIKLEMLILLIVILGGCFYTLSTPMYFAIIIENKQKYLLISYGIIALISMYISRIFVVSNGIIGAAISFTVSMFLLFVGVVIVKVLTK